MGRYVLVEKGRMRRDFDEPEPVPIEVPLERGYVNSDVGCVCTSAAFAGV